MKGVCIVGGSKTGTTGLYASVREAMLRSAPQCYGMLEKYDVPTFVNLQRLAPSTPVIAKLLLTNVAFDLNIVRRFNKRLLIVRDPRDTLLSAALYYPVRAVNMGVPEERISEYVKLVREKERDPASHSFRELLVRVYQLTGKDIRETRDFSRRFRVTTKVMPKLDAHVVRYEDFVTGQLDSVSAYLDLDLRSARPSEYSSLVVRSAGAGEWQNWFTAEDVTAFRPIMSEYMEAFGYEDSWDLSGETSIAASTGSEYIERSCEKRRRQIALNQSDATSDERIAQLRDRADEGAPNASFHAARVLQELGAQEHGLEIRERLLFAACCGHVRAMRNLSSVLAAGIGGPVDADQAMRWEAEAEAEDERVRLRRRQDEVAPGAAAVDGNAARSPRARARAVLGKVRSGVARLLEVKSPRRLRVLAIERVQAKRTIRTINRQIGPK